MSSPRHRKRDRQFAHVGDWLLRSGQILEPEYAAAKFFLQRLDPNAEEFVYRTFSDTPYTRQPGKDPLERELQGSLRNCWKQLVELNQRGAVICVRVNIRSLANPIPDKEEYIRALFIDDDSLRAQPRRFPLDPQLSVESSPGKYHYYWLTTGLDLTLFPILQKLLADTYHTDHRVFDIKQAMQLTGFWRRKDPKQPRLPRLVDYNDNAPYSASELTDLIPIGSLFENEAKPAQT